jgi:hypothetical protein
MSTGSCNIFIVLNKIEASYSWPRKNLHSYHQRALVVSTLVIYGLRPPDEVLNQWLAQPAGILRFTLFYSLGISECRLWGRIPLFLLNA